MGWNPGNGSHMRVFRSHSSLPRDQSVWGAFGLSVLFLSLLEMMDHQDDRGIKDSDSLFSQCLKKLGVFLHAGLDSPGP